MLFHKMSMLFHKTLYKMLMLLHLVVNVTKYSVGKTVCKDMNLYVMVMTENNVKFV
jgi:hypothetical protein